MLLVEILLLLFVIGIVGLFGIGFYYLAMLFKSSH